MAGKDGEPRKTPKLGHYQMGNIIGKGGFGSVYKALDPNKGHFVAIKQVSSSGLNDGEIGSIKMEIELLSKLKHRNIVKYLDSIKTDTHLNIVLEYIEGGSLASILKKFGPFIEALCAIYTLQLLKGLQYLHLQGVIHRDIKGANVLTTKTGLVKLADFGVAMKLSEVDSSKRRVVGTPYWMAPEIVEMNNPTPACDIWSVGSTVVEMATEKPPYADLEQVSALYRIVSDPHPPLPEGITKELESFLHLCFEKNPTNRPSAGDLINVEWIVHFTRHKSDTARRAVSPCMREEDEEEEPDEESETIANIMNTMDQVEGGEHAKPQEETLPGDGKEGSPARRRASVGFLESAASKGNPESLQSSDSDKRNRAHRAVSAEASVGKTANPEESDETMQTMSPVRTCFPRLEQSPKSEPKTVGETFPGSTETMQNKLRFAFLDYYGRLFQTTNENEPHIYGPESTQSNAQEFTQSSSEDVAMEQGSQKMASQKSQLVQLPTAAMRHHGDGDETPLPPLHQDSKSSLVGGKPDVAAPRKKEREAEEIKQLLGSIRPFEEPDVLVGICKRLMELLQPHRQSDSNLHLATQHGAVPIVEMLQVTDPELLRTVLKVVNQIVESNQSFQENFAMSGLIPAVLKFARPHHSRPLRYEAACFVSRLCHTSDLSLQMLVACGGLEALVDLLSHDYYYNRDLVWLAIEALDKIFNSASRQSQKSDFCRILAKHGLCLHLCVLIDTLACDIHNRAAEYLTIVVNLLLLFAKEGDAVVKVYMSKGPVLEGLIASLEFLSPELAVQICRTFKWLAQEPSAPSVMNMLENAGVVPVLVHFLSQHCADKEQAEDEHALDLKTQTSSQANDACGQCMLALYKLCKLSRARQEQAALAGVLPTLFELVSSRKDLRRYAFAMICSMASASLASRKMLWDQGGVAFFVKSLSSPGLPTPSLEALVDWLSVKEHHADWCERVEKVLLKDTDFIRCLLKLFRAPKAEASVFVKILDPLLKLLRVSKGIKEALSRNDDFFQELVNRLKVEHTMVGNSLETGGGNFNSINVINENVTMVEAVELSEVGTSRLKPPSSFVRRLVSEPAVSAGVDVRVRMDLLRLLLLLCESQDVEQRSVFCKRYRLQNLMSQVHAEELRKQRVINGEIAQQLLKLFEDL